MALLQQRPPVMERTAAAAEESAKLHKHFRRFDVLFFLICTLVGIDLIGSIASNGGESFTWLVVVVLAFFVPYALLTAELGSTFPDEGGQYVWTRLAFGRLVAAVNNVLYWVTNPVWLGGSLTILAMTVGTTFFNNGEDVNGLAFYIPAMTFIWVGVLSAILSFQIGKWIATIGAAMRFIVLGAFGITCIVFGIKNGFGGMADVSFTPSYAGFLVLVPLLLFSFVGFELPSAAGEEMKDPQKDVPFAVVRSAIGSTILYALPILGILLVLPASQLTSLGGFIDAIKTVFTVYGGDVASDGTPTLSGVGLVLGDLMAIGFILTLLTSGVTWIMGSDRSLAVSGYDGTAPRALGGISERFGTPVRVNVLSGLVATLVCVLAHQITGGDAQKYFSAVIGVTISTTLISYIFIFPALPILRYKFPNVARPYAVPGGNIGTIIVGVITTIWVLFGTIVIFAPGLGNGWFGSGGTFDDGLPHAWEGQRISYTLTEITPVLVFIAVGVIFWWVGRKTAAQTVPFDLTVSGAEGTLNLNAMAPHGTAGTTAVETMGDPVGVWRDQNGPRI